MKYLQTYRYCFFFFFLILFNEPRMMRQSTRKLVPDIKYALLPVNEYDAMNSCQMFMFNTSGAKMLDKTIFPSNNKKRINQNSGPIVISFIVPKKAINYKKIIGLDSSQFLFIRTLDFFHQLEHIFKHFSILS